MNNKSVCQICEEEETNWIKEENKLMNMFCKMKFFLGKKKIRGRKKILNKKINKLRQNLKCDKTQKLKM